MNVIVATRNQHKLDEIKEIMRDLPVNVLGLDEVSFPDDIEEHGTTFRENASIKAQAVSLYCDDLVMGDDSGIEIDALQGQPGIYSARYLGHDTPCIIKNQKILELLKEETKRGARFVCAIALYQRGQCKLVVEEFFDGEIAMDSQGVNGFGYDPIFYYPPLHKNAASMSVEEKNEVSHRGKAMKRIISYLKEQANEHNNS